MKIGSSAKVLMCVVLLFTGILAGCSSSSGDSTSGDSANNDSGNGSQGSGGKVVVAMPTDLSYMDPQLTFLTPEVSIHFHMFEPLIRYENGEYVPVLAASWEAESPTEWVFKLREDVTFQNGEPFNADTVVWNVERITEEGFQEWAFMEPVDHAEKIDDYTVKIVTKEPYGDMEAVMDHFFIVPPEYMQEVGEDGFAEKPIGTGPYKFVDRVKGSHITLEANPDYWGGEPDIQTIDWRVMPDESARVAAVLSGEADIAMALSPDNVSTIESNDKVHVEANRILRTPYLRLFPDSPQGGGEPLKDVNVRKAINMAIDLEGIIEKLYLGYGERTATLMTEDFPYFDSSVEPYPYDPEKAKELLEDAGYGDGFTLDFYAPNSGIAPKPVELVQAMADDLAKVGIKTNVRTFEMSKMTEMQNERTLAPLHLWSWGGQTPNDKFWGTFHPDSSANFLKNDEVTALIDEGQATLDNGKREEIYTKLQHLVQENAIIGPSFVMYEIYGVSERLDWKPTPDQRVLLLDAKLVKP